MSEARNTNISTRQELQQVHTTRVQVQQQPYYSRHVHEVLIAYIWTSDTLNYCCCCSCVLTPVTTAVVQYQVCHKSSNIGNSHAPILKVLR